MEYEQIEHWFTYHSTRPEQLDGYQAIREAGKQLAHTINKFAPDCADKAAAVRKVREAVMTANASIACDGK